MSEPLNRPQPTTHRRRFLEAMGLVTVGALTPSATGVAAAAAGSDFLLEPGLIYLNTGSVGPSSRAVLDRTVEAWRELETNPVGMVYGNGASHRATDSCANRRPRSLAVRPTNCSSRAAPPRQ